MLCVYFKMAVVLSPLGNDLEITPSADVLKELFRQQMIVFEKKLITKLRLLTTISFE